MDYQSYSFRLVNVGLNLRDSPDKVKEGEYTRLHNVRSTQEGQLQPREGLTLFASTGVNSPVHTIQRLADDTLLIGVADKLFRNNTQYATAGYSGNPLGIAAYRPSASSTAWAYVGDTNQARKVAGSGSDFAWGVVAPTVPALFITAGAGNLDSSVPGASVYDWRYTYSSSATGAESNPSATQNGISAISQQVSVTVTASTDPQVDQINIYRRGGTLQDWLLVTTVGNVSGAYIDNSADSSIAGGPLLHLDRFVPFTTIDASGNTVYGAPLPYVWGPFVGKYLLACGAPNQPGYLFWTNSQLPDESDVVNNVEVTAPLEPLQNGFIYGSNPFVWSRDNLYRVDFGSPTSVTFVPAKTAVGRGIAAPWAFTIGPYVWFLGTDGIYQTDCASPAKSITEEDLRPIFRGIPVANLLPVDYTQTNYLRLAFTGQEVWFFYKDTGGTSRILIYNILYSRWRTGDIGFSALTCGYNDENVSQTRFLVGAADGNVYQINPSIYLDIGTTYNVTCRTGSADMGQPMAYKEYGSVIIDADLQGNMLTVTPYVNTEQQALNSFVISGTGRQKYTSTLGNARAYNIAFDYNWASGDPTNFGGIVYQTDVLWRSEEKAIRHWSLITTHNLLGWQHLNDGYFCLISNDIVTLTLTIDGVDYVYQIPSTGGVRKKQYVQFQAIKGKLFQYQLDCPSDFRLFGSDCEIRVKPWNQTLGYTLVSPFKDSVEP